MQITKDRHASRARRRFERETILPLDPRDPDIARAKEMQGAPQAQRRDPREMSTR
jgi:hypothetical protein